MKIKIEQMAVYFPNDSEMKRMLNLSVLISKMLELDIMNFIRKKRSPLTMPQEIEFVPGLPKTCAGKIMRRSLRAQEWGDEIGDISTLEND